MIGPLSVTAFTVLRYLDTPGTRWHRRADVERATGLSGDEVQGALNHLRRVQFAVSSPVRGETQWSVTDLGGARLRRHGVVA